MHLVFDSVGPIILLIPISKWPTSTSSFWIMRSFSSSLHPSLKDDNAGSATPYPQRKENHRPAPPQYPWIIAECRSWAYASGFVFNGGMPNSRCFVFTIKQTLFLGSRTCVREAVAKATFVSLEECFQSPSIFSGRKGRCYTYRRCAEGQLGSQCEAVHSVYVSIKRFVVEKNYGNIPEATSYTQCEWTGACRAFWHSAEVLLFSLS